MQAPLRIPCLRRQGRSFPLDIGGHLTFEGLVTCFRADREVRKSFWHLPFLELLQLKIQVHLYFLCSTGIVFFTNFISKGLLLPFLRCSGAEPTMSLRYACAQHAKVPYLGAVCSGPCHLVQSKSSGYHQHLIASL